MINRLERDAPFLDLTANDLLGHCTATTNLGSNAFVSRSDGTTYTNSATMNVRQNIGVHSVTNSVCCGVHIEGPEPGDEYTPYSLNAVAFVEDANVRPFFFVGENQGTPTSDAAGDTLARCRLLKMGISTALELNTILLINEYTADAPLHFGVGFHCLGGSSTDVTGRAHIYVRRLVELEPKVLDTTKL